MKPVSTAMALWLLLAPAATTLAEAQAPIASLGTLNRVDAKTGKVNISHEPVPTLGWPAMTMDFRVGDAVDLKSLKPGDRVRFEIQKQGNQYVVTNLQPTQSR
ncbi:MAG: copper-binding protein [Gammaproteobacteria bacterium]